MDIKENELKEYFDKFVKPKITQEFIEKTMLIPYLPKEILEKYYPELRKE